MGKQKIRARLAVLLLLGSVAPVMADTLWQAALPFGGNASPSTYMIDGRQYVVISAGGAKSGRPAGGSIVAFALPETAAKP